MMIRSTKAPEWRKAMCSIAAIAAGCGTSWAESITTPGGYTDLGTLGGGTSQASGISADGSVVVGQSDTLTATHAFRWNAVGGVSDLGTLGGTNSFAQGVNADGSVVVGYSDIAGNASQHPFRWVGGTMSDLGTLGGSYALANGVNADGSVIVGASYTTGNAAEHAFRWVGGTMSDLGTLGGANSLAQGVSANGFVVVGYSDVTGNAGQHAFRWTGSIMSDLGTLGGTNSSAQGVNADGSVVVGYSYIAGDTARHPFRWVGGTMSDLGTLGGSEASAYGVNADGSVVVGLSNVSSGGLRAFRWTQAGGMVSVDNWLRAQGVTLVSDVTLAALSVSADGNVIAGTLQNSHAFVARGPTTVTTQDTPPAVVQSASPSPPQTAPQTVPAGLMDVADYQQSLAGMGRFAAQSAGSDMMINGVNSSPLFQLLDAGRSDVWTSGDLGRVYTQAWGGSSAIGQVGVAHSSVQGLTLRASVGTSYAKQTLYEGGDSRVRGTYVLPEATLALGRGFYGTLTGYANWGDFAVRRGYTNGDGVDLSSGESGTQTFGFRARVDWQNAVRLASMDLSPYTSFTRTSTYVGRYTEQGGAFPAFVNGGTADADIARVGNDATYALASWLTLIGRAEYAHRFERADVATTGTILGLSDFVVLGLAVRQDWVRGGLGAKAQIGPGEALAMANVSNQTVGATYWLNLGYRIIF